MLVAHDATPATRGGAFPALDDPLEPQIPAKLATVTARLGRPRRCAISPATCAVDTAAALSLAGDSDPLLRDCDYGCWTGLTLAEVDALDPDALAAWFADPDARPHGGEALSEVAARVEAWLAACVGRSGRLGAVTHPLVIRIAAVLAIGAPLPAVWRLDVAPLSLTRLTAHVGRWRLAGLNETP